MELSIVIVNYNVKYFLEQCLFSVRKAIKDHSVEVFVVDNNSVDGSISMVKEKFPEVRVFENKINLGFSKANNQAIKVSQGMYVLLLNPDTVLQENTLDACLDFMDSHDDCGGLGVKMIDGKGNFLPESKRSLPTPEIAFYKMFGFSTIFPHSKRFGKYHLSYLDKNTTHQVEVLPGAFMMLRKSALDKVGLLDEDYFMYGEDIDLSYRLTKGGYHNYYFPETTIIHYKGESTKKSSINYVVVFYNAMIIFARKHFSSKNVKLLSLIINTAIWLRAGLSIVKRFFLNFLLPFTDAAIIFAGFALIKTIWENSKYHISDYYPREFLLFIVPAYIIIWLFCIYFTGGYEKPVKPKNLYKGLIYGSIIILVLYALLPLNLRFSRALIILGSLWTLIAISISRLLIHWSAFNDFTIDLNKKKRIAIVGTIEEAGRVEELLKQTTLKFDLVGYISPENSIVKKNFIGILSQIDEVVNINRIDEIIFCAKDVSSEIIIKNMLSLSEAKVSYKIAAPNSVSVIGSNSIDTAGDLYVVNINSINKNENRRNKRLMDICFAVLLLVFSPFFVLSIHPFLQFLKNCVLVLIGKYSWVGYIYSSFESSLQLPHIKAGVLNPADRKTVKNFSNDKLYRLNIQYAKDYNIFIDVYILLSNITQLGRKITLKKL
jgi:O-antigen biosynthesis protein